MEEKQNSYFYKEVEAVFNRFKELASSLLSVFGNFQNFQSKSELKDVVALGDFPWHRLMCTNNVDLPEYELNDEQKEAIARQNKRELDEMIRSVKESIRLLEPVVMRIEEGKALILSLNQLVNEYVSEILNYSYEEFREGLYHSKPIVLTNEELYYGLSMLNDEQVRLVLSEQPQSKFNSLYTSFRRGKEEFLNVIETVDISPMFGLRPMLKIALWDKSSCIDNINVQLSNNPLICSYLVDDLISDQPTNSEEPIQYSATKDVEDIEDPFGLKEFIFTYENAIVKEVAILYTMEDLPKALKNRIADRYNGWKKGNPSLAELDNIKADIAYSLRMNNIATTLLDKWIINTLHDYIDYESSDNAARFKSSHIEESVATETSLMRVFDEVFVFDGHKRLEFVNKYLTYLSYFFSNINSAIALYAFACLFYPEVPKGGRYSEDRLTPSTRLSGGIQWKEHPSDIVTVRNIFCVLDPSRLNNICSSVQKDSVSSAKRYDYLVKLARNKNQQYSWIKNFIEDYWPQVAREEFERKYRIMK